MFEGAHTAIVTPFKDGEVDEPTLRSLIDRQIENGIKGIVPVGTTGESPTLSNDEHRRVIEITVEQVAGRAMVIAGTGSNSTREAIAMTQFAEKAGVDASLQISPYYNKPSQQGLFEHHQAVAESTELPLMLYSISGRTGREISLETIIKLGQTCPNIRAAKEAEGSTERVSELVQALPEMDILSGDDSMTVPFMSVGAVGVVSVASNLIPSQMAELVAAMLKDDLTTARSIHQKYYKLFSGFLKLDTNPVPIKEALGMAGLIVPTLRRPMVSMSDDGLEVLREIMTDLELL